MIAAKILPDLMKQGVIEGSTEILDLDEGCFTSPTRCTTCYDWNLPFHTLGQQEALRVDRIDSIDYS